MATLVDEWLMDTACPTDLIDRKCTENIKRHIRVNPNPPTFATANGKTTAHEEVPVTVPELNEDIAPHVMENSPNVLSIGYRVVEQGYKFVWYPYQRVCYLIRPDGTKITLYVKGYCPYLKCKSVLPAMAVIPGAKEPKAMKVVPFKVAE